jgi:hypothetical protein
MIANVSDKLAASILIVNLVAAGSSDMFVSYIKLHDGISKKIGTLVKRTTSNP